MAKIAREEAKRWLRQQLAPMEREAAVYEHGNSVIHREYGAFRKHEVACLRLALAALEDAERVEWLDATTHQDDVALWVRSNQWHVVLTGDAHDRGFDGSSLRAAIDRARGAE